MRLRIYNGYGCLVNKTYASVKGAKIAVANMQRRFNNFAQPDNYLVADISSYGTVTHDYTTDKAWEKV